MNSFNTSVDYMASLRNMFILIFCLFLTSIFLLRISMLFLIYLESIVRNAPPHFMDSFSYCWHFNLLISYFLLYWYLMWCKISVHVHLSAYVHLFSEHYLVNTLSFPHCIVWMCLGNSVLTPVWIYFWILHSVLLIMCLFLSQ